MEKPERKILYDEQGLKPGSEFKKEQWKAIASHNDNEIKGFFGEYRFLSNFWPAKVSLDGEEYNSTENAYQAAKYKKEKREFFKKCSPKEAVLFVRDHFIEEHTIEEWGKAKLEIMKNLLLQKFDKNLNTENYKKLLETGDRYLEETNYWGDTFWGVYKSDLNEEGVGENNLGKLLMDIRKKLVEQKKEENN